MIRPCYSLTAAFTGLKVTVHTNIATQVTIIRVAGITEALHRVSRCEDDKDRYEGFLHVDAARQHNWHLRKDLDFLKIKTFIK